MTSMATSARAAPDIGDRFASVIDLKGYPIDRPGTAAYRAMVEEAWRGLDATGACVFERFMLPSAVEQALAQVDPMQASAFVCGQPHNVYLVGSDPALPPDHARNRLVRSEKAVLADDEVPATSPVRAIYDSERFRAFIRDALKIDRLFSFDDPLASVNISFYGDNQELGWHFDNSIFTVTLMLRQSEQGGLFEYAPNIREEGAAGFDKVGRILDGDPTLVQELKQDPGALVLFKGSRSLHRVTPSFGPEPRAIAILSYASEPNYGLKEHTRRLFYGRIG